MPNNIIKMGGNGKVIGNFFTSEAAAYIKSIETADGQALEPQTKIAINTFIRGCKIDGNWDAIKSSCILAGARTLNGALISLKGTAPTNVNFISSDYNRATGLKGDGSSKYLNFKLQNLRWGEIKVNLKNSYERNFKSKEGNLSSNIFIKDNSFFKDLLFKGELGFAESYINNKWETSNLSNLLKILLKNQQIKKKIGLIIFFQHL